MNTHTTKKLYRSLTDKQLTGLCGGIADYIGVDSSVVRLLWIAVTVLTGFMPGLIGYVVASMVVPKAPVVG